MVFVPQLVFIQASVNNTDTRYLEDALEEKIRQSQDLIFVTDPEVDRQKILTAKGTRVPGTCEWIKQDPTYMAWLHRNTNLLWVSGAPGKGKTMFSLFIIEHLQEKLQNVDGTAILFFFCSHDDENKKTANNILRGLIHEILEKRPQVFRSIVSFFSTKVRTHRTLSSFEALWLCFEKCIQSPDLGTIFCVLDGLDECDDSRQQLIERLLNMYCSV